MKPTAFTAALVTILLVTTPTFALAQAGSRTAGFTVSPAVTANCAGVQQALRGAMPCATALAASLQATQGDVGLLLAAGRLTDRATPKTILGKHGLTSAQLDGATVVIVDQTGGDTARFKIVSVEVSCCPLTIVITIKF